MLYFPHMKFSKEWLISIVISSLLLILTLHPFNISLFSWIALVPLLYVVFKRNRLSDAIVPFLITGLIASYFGMGWVLRYQKGVFFIVWPLMSLIFPIFGVSLYLIKKCLRNNFLLTLIAPSLWIVLLELYSFTYLGYNWGEEFFSYSQTNRYLIQSVSLFGTQGLTFLIIYFNSSISTVLVSRKKISMLLLIPVLLFISALLFYGYKEHSKSRVEKGEKSLNIVLVQPGISGEEGFEHITPRPGEGIVFRCMARAATVPNFTRLNYEAQAKEPDLIIWPQYNLPVDIVYRSRRSSTALNDFYARFAKPILMGTFIYKDSKVVNISVLLDGNGNVSDMRSLVEGPPFRKTIQTVEKELKVLDFSPFWLSRSFKLGSLLCYEDVSSKYALELVQKGAEVLVVQVNNEMFQNTRLPFMHFRRDIFRAVETRRWIIRAATTGISAFISPLGEVVERIDLGKEEIRCRRIPIRKYKTFYAKHSNSTCIISLMFLFFGLLTRFINIIVSKINTSQLT